MRPILRSAAEYGRDTGRAMIAFLVGAAFTLTGQALDLLGVHLSGKLITVGGILLMVVAQFWAYHKLRLRYEETEEKLRITLGERPEIDRRLVLINEAPGLTPPDEPLPPLPGEERFPDHALTLEFGVAETIDPALTFDCTAPIYRAFAIYRLAGEEDEVMVEPSRRRQDGVLFRFGEEPLTSGSRFTVYLFSPVPVGLRRARPAVSVKL